jgi:hypothetical protein
MILASDEHILKACPNSIKFAPASSWILPEVYDTIDIHRKLPRISSLTGWKNFTDGHKYRQELYFNQLSIQLPIDWYRSGQPPFIDDIKDNKLIDSTLSAKSSLFLDYQYSIVIENVSDNNMFTEKLIDCLITKTIPIYWGCPNIHEYFDTSGWILLNDTTVDELVNKCKILPDYISQMATVTRNYETAKQYTNYEQRIAETITRFENRDVDPVEQSAKKSY